MKQTHNLSYKLLSTFCAISALAVTFVLPGQAFALQDSANTDVNVKIEPYITLDVATGSTTGDKVVDVADVTGNPNLKVGAFTAKVTSNKGYNIFISTPNGENLTADLVNASNNQVIKTISTSASTLSSTGWGIKCNSADCTNKNYRGIPLYSAIDTTNPFYNKTTAATDNSTEFEVGVYVGGEVSSGIYTTNILVTAAQI